MASIKGVPSFHGRRTAILFIVCFTLRPGEAVVLATRGRKRREPTHHVDFPYRRNLSENRTLNLAPSLIGPFLITPTSGSNQRPGPAKDPKRSFLLPAEEGEDI